MNEFYLYISLNDPTVFQKNAIDAKYPITVAILLITLKREYEEIINDHSKPQSILFDAAILRIEFVSIDELPNNRKRQTSAVTCCAYCGYGLGDTLCKCCGHEFEVGISISTIWRTPLSPKMVEFLQDNGHTFKQDPVIAWELEKKNWEAKNRNGGY